MRRFLPLALLVLPLAGLDAQLPYLTAPKGTLRLEFGGRFESVSREFADGTARDFGAPLAAGALTASNFPAVTDLEARLSAILGTAPVGGSLGSLSASAMLQRGTGVIGVGVGVSARLTAFVNVPIVSIRTEARLDEDPTGATLGINPAFTGDGGSQLFLDQFDAALATVQQHLDAGDYAGNPSLEALAGETLAEGPGMRAALAALLVGPGTASAVLPVRDSPDGQALLATVTDFRARFTDQLGVPEFTASPSLPSAPIPAEAFAPLLSDAGGFDLATFDEQPLVGIGDVDVGATWQLVARADTARRSWFGAWLTGSLTLPSGTPPRPDHLRDGGTGDGQLDATLGGTVEAGRHRLGVRASASYRRQFAGTREARVGTRDQFLLPANRLATLRWDPGDVLTVDARPYYRLVDRLAIVGMVQWWKRSADAWSLADGATAPAGGDATAMGNGTAASALRVGLGLSYAHDGSARDGVVRMPVEAGLGIERVLSSGSGLVEAPVTTRLWFRVYKRLW